MSRALKESHDLPGVMLDNRDEGPFMQIEKETFLQYFFSQIWFQNNGRLHCVVDNFECNNSTEEQNEPPTEVLYFQFCNFLE